MLSKYILPVPYNFDYGLAFKVTNTECTIPFILIFVYLPPHGSSAYPCDEQNGITHLENYVNLLEVKYPDYGYVISGDANARTKDLLDYILDDNVNYVPVPDFYINDNFCKPRKSRDLHGDINAHGDSLLNFCCVHDIHILNGRMNDDMEGHLTCFTGNGSSLVDYTLASTKLFTLFQSFEIGDIDEYTHLPQIFSMVLPLNTFTYNAESVNVTHDNRCDSQNIKRTFYKWTADSFQKLTNSDYLIECNTYIDSGDINNAIKCFNSLLQDSCVKNIKQQENKKRTNAEWWDSEMSLLKSSKYKCLRNLRREPCERYLHDYREIRKLYKSKIKEKIFLAMNENRKKVECCKSASEFWKFVKSKYENRSCLNNISANDWKIYFQELLNSSNIIDADFDRYVNGYLQWHDKHCMDCVENVNEINVDDELNRPFTLREVEIVVEELASGKAPGLDGISNEILKYASVVIVPLLYKLFNVILDTKCFPDEWSDALIVPVYKKGNKSEPNNYRGISLLSSIGKIFTKLLNKRLVKWADDNNKLSDEQAGFRKGKSTIDQIFIFQSIISKYLSKKRGRFYTVYIDFSKAFDSVPHLQLIYHLIKSGVHGKLICVIRNMYSKLSSCVQSYNGSISEHFTCSVGTRQGCMISPLLFILYIDELVKQAYKKNCKGIYIDEHHTNISMLLYADDLVIMGDRIGHIQCLLDNLSLYCSKWGLSVNMEKTKFMVFRNGGIVKSNEKVYFYGNKIEQSSYYKYLGLLISSRLSWSPAQRTLSQQAEKAMNYIYKVNYECNFSYMTSSNIFDKCVLPIVLYGSEIWGVKAHNVIECVLLKFCRQQLGVGTNAPAPALLGECGRSNLYVNCYIRSIKYWLKLIQIPDGSLLKSCYTMLLKHCNAGRINWAWEIKQLLYRFGFGYIWESQNVFNDSKFLHDFGRRVLDCSMQAWQENMSNMSKLRTLCLFKTNIYTEPYLFLWLPQKIRSSIAKFRIGVHDLEIERGRHHNIPVVERICKLCSTLGNTHIEDEYHVLILCPFYNELRISYLNIQHMPKNLYTFVSIMSLTGNDLSQLGSFITNMFKLRKTLLLSLQQ